MVSLVVASITVTATSSKVDDATTPKKVRLEHVTTKEQHIN